MKTYDKSCICSQFDFLRFLRNLSRTVTSPEINDMISLAFDGPLLSKFSKKSHNFRCFHIVVLMDNKITISPEKVLNALISQNFIIRFEKDQQHRFSMIYKLFYSDENSRSKKRFGFGGDDDEDSPFALNKPLIWIVGMAVLLFALFIISITFIALYARQKTVYEIVCIVNEHVLLFEKKFEFDVITKCKAGEMTIYLSLGLIEL